MTPALSSTLPAAKPALDFGASDETLLDEICGGDDAAFNELVGRYNGAMVRLARTYVPSTALAEEAAQEAWMAILKGCRHFERRSSVKTWMFRILINRAVTHAVRERRDDQMRSADVDAPRFHPADHPLAGAWLVPPRTWTPEERVLSNEIRGHVEEAIADLPLAQRQVITLRDVYGWSSHEVCDLYSISESNQRVLLHRARARVRHELEEFSCAKEASSCRPM